MGIQFHFVLEHYLHFYHNNNLMKKKKNNNFKLNKYF